MTRWKGILMAGGTGSRLAPLTSATNKHLLPVWDKPMLYYPLSTLMLSGIRDIIVVTTPTALPQIQKLLHDGSQWGLRIEYLHQDEPKGIAECFLLAEHLLEGCNTALILGDNIFYGSGLPKLMEEAIGRPQGATIFGYEVSDPSAFGVVSLNAAGEPISIVEKPTNSNSKLAVPGLYFYDENVVEITRQLTPSSRGELEITEVNLAYLKRNQLRARSLGRGVAWLDGGTPSDMYEASQFIKVLEERTGLKIGCPEEIAFRQGFVGLEEFKRLGSEHSNPVYGDYLLSVSKLDVPPISSTRQELGS